MMGCIMKFLKKNSIVIIFLVGSVFYSLSSIAAVKNIICGSDTTIKPKNIRNKIQGRTIKIEKL